MNNLFSSAPRWLAPRAGLVLAASLAAVAAAQAATGGPVAPAQVYRTAATMASATGAFGTATAYSTGTSPAGTYPAAVAAADFNLDGRPDVVTANLSDNTITVFLNTGTGTFPSPGVTYAVGSSPIAVATGDFNLDGNIDIVTANANSSAYTSATLPNAGTVTVLLGSSSGTFTTSGTYGTGGASSLTTSSATTPVSTSSPAGVAVGLLNTDTYPDIVVTNADGGTVGVLLNTGSGTFPTTATTYAVGSYPIGVALGDFNLDGRPDIVTANSLGNTISVLLNTGAGTFGTQTAYAVGNEPSAVAVGLLNADTYPDIVVANTSGNTVSVVLNTGSGTFPGSSPTYAVGSSPGAVLAADLDVDGDVDLVTANGNANTISVLLNAGPGTYGTAVAYSVGSVPTGIAVGLLDTDAAPDLITANGLGNTISTLLGTASPLPVRLVSFTATAQGKAALLKWATASETNNAGFEAEVSVDGLSFRTLAFVAGAGTSGSSHSYTYSDAQLTAYGASVVYYRLRQFDTDGSSSYSPVRSVAVPTQATALTLYPNPVHETLTVTGTTAGSPVQVFNALGQVVLTAEADNSGTTQLLLPAALPAGLYIVRSGSQSQRVLVQ